MSTSETNAADAEALQGTAQHPKTSPWSTNHDGPRTESAAVELARSKGVVIHEDVKIIFRDDLVSEGAWAEYGGFQSYRPVRWADLQARGKIPVKVRRSVLESDEAIVAMLAHEMHEINALRDMFEERDSIPGDEIIRLIRPGIPGNLHDQAWDVADRLVFAMRGEKPC